jgi:FlaA1/EpsC-like NDP-sugar epimerase
MVNRLAEPFLGLPRPVKRFLALTVDSLLCIACVWIAFCLRLEGVHYFGLPQLKATAAALGFTLPFFISSGLYRAIFRYSGMAALMALVKACAIFALLYLLLFTVMGVPGVPRSLGLGIPLLVFSSVGGSRLFARYWLGGIYVALLNRKRLPQVLIYGAGMAGQQTAAALVNSPELVVSGFIDDAKALQGSTLNGLAIYPPARMRELVEDRGITDVLLAMPSVGRRRRAEIVREIEALRLHLHVRSLPGLMNIAKGHVQIQDIRELEIEDLLGRDPVPPNHALLQKNVQGKVVLVTGAGGSIGSELCRQIMQLKPSALLLLDSSEYALYTIHQELRMRSQSDAVRILPFLGSVRDEMRMREIMQTWRPTTVYHAAAYKHVPLVEHNPTEGVRNNVIGTLVAARVAAEFGVDSFVLISTDKAVRPTNVMGASKRLAEMVLQGLAQLPGPTCFSMVRFGNVLGSSGSVVPLFRQQIGAGGPITLTHKDITRYFMTIPEAAQLVIQAGAMASGGDVFVLDMGDPVKIIDLARRMVELSGLSVRDADNQHGDIELVITGLRPGEKLYEELLIGDNPLHTQHPRIMRAQERMLPWHELSERLDELEIALATNNVKLITQLLKLLVSGYNPTEEIVDWVHLERRRQVRVPPVPQQSLVHIARAS